ncbi:MAG: DUF3148 domain-containing protein [Leptolyngbyaceae cyanobacterium SM1_1_3]|nr:DUF3148 domain-containing protein [Leptolyngbyaceae cyanobacterium SM1_1_3]NJM85251.1 DUF3148 domain-containing protein [Leptolyngbyaceae cyanobacterium RM2_2_21]NJN03909.1 DUF3148 domain-containing protein [Leptolyngbyaceae cyanobacterium RM1_1_2]NJO09017.1 DUF3148 domain-containing protein [Leptolyngbyaceae cyanobacterium SL_1_1]
MSDFAVGDRVRVVTLPPYLKTADTMPMLRPPDLVQIGEEGIVVDRRPSSYWGVKFERGTFLIDRQYIEAAQSHTREEPVSDSTGNDIK